MQHLAASRNKLLRRLNSVDELFYEYIKNNHGRKRSLIDWIHLEGYISYAWQTWGNFCRTTIIKSSLGCTTLSGKVIHPSPLLDPCTWERVSYIAKQAAQKNNIKPNNTNHLLLHEPTWGDIDKIPLIINALSPENKEELKSGFGIATKIKDLQNIRNAIAHRNLQTLQEIISTAPKYKASRIYHPSEAALWLDTETSNFAFLSWTDEMRTASELAIK